MLLGMHRKEKGEWCPPRREAAKPRCLLSFLLLMLLLQLQLNVLTVLTRRYSC